VPTHRRALADANLRLPAVGVSIDLVSTESHPENRRILGFDTATADTAVAVTADGEALAESSRGAEPGSGRPVHATALLVEIERAVDAAGGWTRIDRIAVGLGPGSFTGLRVGLAAARSLATARRLPVVGGGTLAILAAGILEQRPGEPALAVIDARRGEVFAALYDGGGVEVWAPFVAAPDALAERVAEASAKPLAAGDGSLRFRGQLEEAGALVADEGDPVHRVAARRLCQLAQVAEPTPLEGLQPIYLRKPDAETWRERQRRDAGA
jgi:tRNA threonylcarbamoyladenosine biosynthesis protein TsaB